jgi:phage antirepressor YoqD-like protein
MNELINFNPNNMSKEQLDMLQDQIFNRRLQDLENKQIKLNKDNELKHEEINNRINDIEEQLMPYVKGFDRFMDYTGKFTMETAAKLLDYKDAGRNSLYDILESKDILWHDYIDSQKIRKVKQSYVGLGYFKVKAGIKDGISQYGNLYEIPYTQVFVTSKGLCWLDKKLNEWGYERNPDS